MLRHVARFASEHRLLFVGTYRDIELDRQHPLSNALEPLRRETNYERIVLKGLDRDEVNAKAMRHLREVLTERQQALIGLPAPQGDQPNQAS